MTYNNIKKSSVFALSYIPQVCTAVARISASFPLAKSLPNQLSDGKRQLKIRLALLTQGRFSKDNMEVVKRAGPQNIKILNLKDRIDCSQSSMFP